MSTSSATNTARPPRRRFLSLFPMLATSTVLASTPAAPATAVDKPADDPVLVAWAECQRQRKAFEVVDRQVDTAAELPDYWYDAQNSFYAAENAVIDTLATSLAGVELKLQAIVHALMDDPFNHTHFRLLESALRDVRSQMEA